MFAFGCIPVMDLLVSEDTTNPTKEQSSRLAREFRFKLIPAFWVPTQFALMVYSGFKFCTPGLALYEYIGIITSIGILAGSIGINVAHELIHKPSWWEKLLGRALLASVCYGHWADEHLYGHHKLVSTPFDPATSRFGESFYTFWFRTVWGTWTSALDMERRRLRNVAFPERILRDRVFLSCLSSLAVAACFGLLMGPYGVLFFFLQSPVAFTMLEAVNYIEHYGLQRELVEGAPSMKELEKRKKLGDYGYVASAFESVTPFHSWNAGETVTNYFLLKLQRHSDHHANGYRRYQVLRSFLASPQLPTGYAGCMVLATIPPLWFAIMNPRVKKVKSQIEYIKGTGINVFSDEFDVLARKEGSVEAALRKMNEGKKK